MGMMELVIKNEILKCCSLIIEPYLVDLFNEYFTADNFPNFLKIPKDIPFFLKSQNTKGQ